MRPHNDSLNRLRVASPCNEDWNTMTGNDAVRFCSHCSRDVYDVSNMTRERALQIVRESNGRLCMRIERRPDGRVRTADALPGFFSITRRVPRAAAGVLSLAVGVSTATAQQTACPSNPPAVAARTDADLPLVSELPPDEVSTVSGTVEDAQGAVIPGATIVLSHMVYGPTITGVTDESGNYTLNVPHGGYSLIVTAQGFRKSVVSEVVAPRGEQVHVTTTLETGYDESLLSSGGMVIVVSAGESMVRHEAEREAKIDEDAVDPPIIEAADSGRADLWRAIRRGDDVNARNSYGETALMRSVYDRKAVAKLLDYGADVNARDRFGVTALMRAAAGGNRKVAAALLDRGADVDVADVSGYTALMVAAANGDQRMVQLLVDAGADRSMRDKTGKTAKDYFPVAEPDAESNSDPDEPHE